MQVSLTNLIIISVSHRICDLNKPRVQTSVWKEFRSDQIDVYPQISANDWAGMRTEDKKAELERLLRLLAKIIGLGLWTSQYGNES
jgi:hypothetical protein